MRECYYPTHTQINITLKEKIGTLLNYITLQQHEFKGSTHYKSQHLLLHASACLGQTGYWLIVVKFVI